jgi:predicted transcriptional regulator
MPETKSAKEITLKLVERLDEDVTYEDIMYELYALQKIERGLRDAEEGRTVSHEEVKDQLSQWLK